MTPLKKRYLALSGVGIGVAALAVSTFGIAHADMLQEPSECEVTELGAVDGSISARTYDLSPNGEYFAGSTIMEGEEDQPPTLWHGTEPEVIEVDEPGVGGHFGDVNDSGDAVGTWTDDMEEPLIYRDGEASIGVPGPDLENSRLVAINNDGDIVGHTMEGTEKPSRPFVWRAGADEAVELSTPGGGPGFTADMNEDGTIVGWESGEEPGDGTPLVWDSDNNPIELPQPETSSESIHTPRNIGGDWAATGEPHGPARWDLSDLDNPVAEDLDVNGYVSTVNPQGWMGAFDQELDSPVLITDESTVELPLPTDDVGRVPYPAGISDDGAVVTGTVTTSEAHIPLVWNCE